MAGNREEKRIGRDAPFSIGLRKWNRCEGFTFLGLMVMAAVLALFATAAHPLWKQIDRRDREKELIFRGTQYAHAIARFKRKFGRTPLSLEELHKEKCIPRLYEDPMLLYIEHGESGGEASEEEEGGSGFDFGFNFDMDSDLGFGSGEEEEDEKSYGGWEIVYSTVKTGKRRRKNKPGEQQGQRQQGQSGKKGIGGIIGVRTKCDLESLGGWPAGQQKAGTPYSEWMFVMNQADAPWQYPGLGRNPEQTGGPFQSQFTLEPGTAEESGQSDQGSMFTPPGGGSGKELPGGK